ncbi:unnamed protein product [Closterium sp. NIES-64]|nr:unnamed protein product [Closterium sp. NIES-64]
MKGKAALVAAVRALVHGAIVCYTKGSSTVIVHSPRRCTLVPIAIPLFSSTLFLFPHSICNPTLLFHPVPRCPPQSLSIPPCPSLVPPLSPHPSPLSMASSIVAALTTLVHGSTTDIGWLANHPKLPAVRDRTDQYARTLRQVMQGHHSLPDDLIYLLIPGLFSNLSPLYLLDTREHFSSLGLTCEIAKIDSQAGVEANARVLRDTVTALLAGKADEGEEIYAHGFPSQVSATSATHSNGSSGAAAGDEKSAKRQRVGEGAMRSKSETGNASGTGNGGNKSGNGSADGDSNSNRKRRVLLIGHSKGGLDAAAALALFPAQLNSSTVAGLVCMQSPYGGTPMASDILREGSLGNGTLRSVLELLLDKLFKGDIRCLEDLTYTRRHAFLSHHPLPPSIPCLSFHTNASRAPAVIVSLSTITHTEIPWLARTSQKLALAFPLSAALAALSLYLENRYGAESDGLVTRADAEVPGSIVVRARRQMDHGFMVFPSMGQSRRANGGNVPHHPSIRP